LKKQETKPQVVNKSIFELRKNILKTTNEAQEIIEKYSTNYDNWWKISKYVKDIDNRIKAFEENYEESMEVGDEVSFSSSSYFLDNQNYVEIDNCIWKRKDNNNDFSTDGDAERKFAKLLKDISKNISTNKNEMFEEFSLFGKNFTQNSKISFEYYNFGIHKSYPDFVLKDKNGTIHIFEVKSVNKSGNSFINEDEYNNKVNQLEKCYKFASKKTNQVFYLPILDGENWKITKYKNGEEKEITKDDLTSQFCNNL
jgi:type III restriction enzyme